MSNCGRKRSSRCWAKSSAPIRSIHPASTAPTRGYAVILEEYEEASEEQRYFKASLDSLWIAVRSDRDPDVLERILDTMRERALNLVMEAIQVAAMTQKMIDTVEGMGDV